jgi:hypothetical protein
MEADRYGLFRKVNPNDYPYETAGEKLLNYAVSKADLIEYAIKRGLDIQNHFITFVYIENVQGYIKFYPIGDREFLTHY